MWQRFYSLWKDFLILYTVSKYFQNNRMFVYFIFSLIYDTMPIPLRPIHPAIADWVGLVRHCVQGQKFIQWSNSGSQGIQRWSQTGPTSQFYQIKVHLWRATRPILARTAVELSVSAPTCHGIGMAWHRPEVSCCRWAQNGCPRDISSHFGSSQSLPHVGLHASWPETGQHHAGCPQGRWDIGRLNQPWRPLSQNHRPGDG